MGTNMRQRPHGSIKAITHALLATTAGLLGASSAFAQTSDAPKTDLETASVAESQPDGSGDIIVTARKRQETTQDIPVSITAYGAETIEKQDLSSLEKVAAITPQFTIGRAATGSGAQLTIRGLGSNSSSIGIEQSVAVVVDSVYYGQGRIINEGLFDLGRIEVLKGPQALFFGKNATAGVISITTADPGNKLELRARAAYEFNAENVIGEFVASTPLTDTLGVRIAVRGSKMYGGYVENLAGPQVYTTRDIAMGNAATVHPLPAAEREVPRGHELLGRATVKWSPTEDLDVTLKASASEADVNDPGWNTVLFACPTGVSQQNPTVRCGERFKVYHNRHPVSLASVQDFANKDGSLGNQYRAWNATGTINYDFGPVTLTSVTNYNHNKNSWQLDGDFTSSVASTASIATERSSFGAFSSELRALTSFDSQVNGMIGAYYQNTERVYNSTNAAGGLENSAAPLPSQRYLVNSKDSQTDGETFAVFGQLIWTPSSEFEVAVGGRYTDETKDSYFLHPYVHPARAAPGIFVPNVTITSNQKFDDFSPEATVTYKPTTDITVYGAYKTGYKSGGFSNSAILSRFVTVADFAFGPETVEGFEGGLKTRLFNRQLLLNIGAYTYKYSDLQVDFFNAGTFAFTTFNAASARVKGIEAEFNYTPSGLRGFSVQGTLNYNSARYISFPTAPCYTGQTIAQGCRVVGTRTVQDLSGVETSVAPKWVGSLGASYDTEITSNWNLGISAQARYSDDYLASPFGNELSRQDSYVTFDASVRLQTADERWELALIGKNLTNKFYVTGLFEAPFTGSGTGTAAGIPADQVGYAALPRTVQAQLTWRY